jgi:nucleotide-binding universal stress UspA family protein
MEDDQALAANCGLDIQHWSLGILDKDNTMISKILLCSDGSAHALKAAEAAAEIAKKFNAEVTLVNVYSAPVFMMPVAIDAAPYYADTDGELAEQSHNTVEMRTGKVLESCGVKFTTRREQGHAVEQIVRTAEEEKCDLIVMGSRGMGGFERFFLGSVSDGVLHHAHCPVLIVR